MISVITIFGADRSIEISKSYILELILPASSAILVIDKV